MITASQYGRRTQQEWKGVRVRSLQPIGNSMGTMPAGTVFTIEQKFGGFDLKSEVCACCGFQMRVSRVGFQKLELIDG